LYGYLPFISDNTNSNFVPGTFGYAEEYNTPSQLFYINYLQDDASVYAGTPFCLFQLVLEADLDICI